MSRDNKSNLENNWISREDLQDIAKIGGDLLKRTVTSSIDVIKDVTDTLPKDASQLISKSREEMMKGLSREFAQNLVSHAVERVFSAVREHQLDISIKLRKANDDRPNESQKKPNPSDSHDLNKSQFQASRSSQHDDIHDRGRSERTSHAKRNHQNRHRP